MYLYTVDDLSADEWPYFRELEKMSKVGTRIDDVAEYPLTAKLAEIDCDLSTLSSKERRAGNQKLVTFVKQQIKLCENDLLCGDIAQLTFGTGVGGRGVPSGRRTEMIAARLRRSERTAGRYRVAVLVALAKQLASLADGWNDEPPVV